MPLPVSSLPRHASWLFAVAAVAAWAVPTQGLAQTGTVQAVRGSVVDAQTGAPVEGAMIVLLPEEGDAPGASAEGIAQVLTDAEGRFLLRVPEAGIYRLRADRIGHSSTFEGPFRVDPGQTRVVELRARVEAIQLAGLDVDAERQCRVRPDEGEQTARIWEEARKALAAAAWTERSGVYRYELERSTRELDQDARRVVRETTRREIALRQRTFVSRAAEELRDAGYAQQEGSTWVYYAPDANVLLSDAFLDSHCFGVRTGEDANQGLVGLTFIPLPDRRSVDIDGTLWLDPASGELRRLDFRYRNLPGDVLHDELGGVVEFARLPTGPWIVSRFVIRMPLLQDQRIGTRFQRSVTGFSEESASVRRIRDARGEPVLEFESGTLAGSVRAIYGTDPLDGARVTLVGSDREAFTDEEGRFRMTGLETGSYLVAYTHARLDSIGVVVEPVGVDVERGSVTFVALEAPSPYQALLARCGEEELAEGSAALLGWAREDHSGAALPGAEIQVLWSRFDIRTGEPRPEAAGRIDPDAVNAQVLVSEQSSGFLATTDERGFYLVCGVPTNTPLEISAEWQHLQRRPVRIRIPGGALHHPHDVHLRGAPPAP